MDGNSEQTTEHPDACLDAEQLGSAEVIGRWIDAPEETFATPGLCQRASCREVSHGRGTGDGR